MTSQKSDTHPNSLDSPFAKAVLLKQALPLTAGGLFTAMVSFATYGEALDQHWTTAWLLLTVGTVLFSYFGIIRLYKPLLWAIGLAILLIQGIRGGTFSMGIAGVLGLALDVDMDLSQHPK